MSEINNYEIYAKNEYSKVIFDSYYAMSDTNNALYVYDKNRKVYGLFNKDYIYGIVEKSRVYDSYPEVLGNLSEKSNFIFEVIFDNDDHIYVNADRYDHNVYTNIVSFQVFTDEGTGKGYATTIGTFNMNNLIGIRKISFIKSKDIVGEI